MGDRNYRDIAIRTRRWGLYMIHCTNGSRVGTCFFKTDILAVLYGDVLCLDGLIVIRSFLPRHIELQRYIKYWWNVAVSQQNGWIRIVTMIPDWLGTSPTTV